MLTISSWLSWWNTMVSSMRFKNSGRKCCLSSCCTFAFICSYAFVESLAEANPRLTPLDTSRLPRLVVMMMTVFLKSTERPCASVSRPSSKHLQQRVEDVGVRLLDLVEEHHRERLAPHLLGELATLFVADVTRRRTEQPGRSVLLAELAHVEGDERVLVTEEELGERLAELGLTHTGRTGEDE